MWNNAFPDLQETLQFALVNLPPVIYQTVTVIAAPLIVINEKITSDPSSLLLFKREKDLLGVPKRILG
jgi:hypothetical protein